MQMIMTILDATATRTEPAPAFPVLAEASSEGETAAEETEQIVSGEWEGGSVLCGVHGC